jgi:hypothetical protein
MHESQGLALGWRSHHERRAAGADALQRGRSRNDGAPHHAAAVPRRRVARPEQLRTHGGAHAIGAHEHIRLAGGKPLQQ